jgi:hypothetical protein
MGERNQLFYRVVLGGKGVIDRPEPYCERHVMETGEFGDELKPTGKYTGRRCVICQFVNWKERG